jgi:hypothetical protein
MKSSKALQPRRPHWKLPAQRPLHLASSALGLTMDVAPEGDPNIHALWRARRTTSPRMLCGRMGSEQELYNGKPG